MTYQNFRGPYDEVQEHTNYLPLLVLEYNQILAKINEITTAVISKAKERTSTIYEQISIDGKRFKLLKLYDALNTEAGGITTVCLIPDKECLAVLSQSFWSTSKQCYIFTKENGDYIISLKPARCLSQLGLIPKDKIANLKGMLRNMASYTKIHFNV